MIEKFLYSRKEAAYALGISVRSLDYLIAGKQLDMRRIGKKVLVTHASLAAFSSANHYAITSRSDADAVASGERETLSHGQAEKYELLASIFMAMTRFVKPSRHMRSNIFPPRFSTIQV